MIPDVAFGKDCWLKKKKRKQEILLSGNVGRPLHRTSARTIISYLPLLQRFSTWYSNSHKKKKTCSPNPFTQFYFFKHNVKPQIESTFCTRRTPPHLPNLPIALSGPAAQCGNDLQGSKVARPVSQLMREVAIAPCLLSHVCACACLHFEKWDNSDHQNVFVACVAKKKKRTSHKVHVHTYFDDCVIFPLCVTSWGKKGIPNKSVSPFMELALLAMAVV